MTQSTIENESIQERQHSCKWYFDEATVVYDNIRRGIDENISNIPCRLREKLASLDVLLKRRDLFPKKKDENKTQEEYRRQYKSLLGSTENGGKNADLSVFPLFVRRIESNTPAEISSSELFEKKKFEICKVLNAIDSIVSRLCSDNVDYLYSSDKGNVVGAETILKWLYTSADKGEATKQEYDRATVVFRQIVNWYKKQKSDLGAKLNDDQSKNVRKLLDEVFVVSTSHIGNTVSTNGWDDDKCKRALLADIKKTLGDTLDDAENAYKKLNGFRRYAIRYEMATEEMTKEANLNKLLSLANAILSFFLSICVAYMRINKLQLPRAEFRGARLIHTNISGSNFSNADFTHVDMARSIAKNCDFSSATLRMAKADNADFSDSLFSYADLSGVDFSDATMNHIKMDAVDIGEYTIYQWERLLNPLSEEGRELFDTKWDRGAIFDNLRECTSSEREQANKGSAFFENTDSESSFLPQPKSEEYLSSKSMEELCKQYDNQYVSFIKPKMRMISLSPDNYDDIRRHLSSNSKLKMLIKLSGASIKCSVLTDLNLSLVNMERTSFNESDMSGCSLAYSKAESADFSGTNLSSAIAYGAHFENATFGKALLFNTCFVDCYMESVNFTEANMTKAQLINTSSKTQNYIKKTVEIREVFGVPIPQIKDAEKQNKDTTVNRGNMFIGVNANKITIAGCDLVRSSFENAIFRSSTLFDVNATSTVWDNADLMYSLLCGIVFNRSSMKRVTMQESRVYGSDFSCCNLSKSRLLECKINKAVFYDSNMDSVNLSHSAVYNTVFRDSSVDKMNVSYTDFVNCIFIGIDFSTMIGLQNTTFTDCIFIKCKDKHGEVNRFFDGVEYHLLQINDIDLICSDKNYTDVRSKFSTKKE